MDRQNRSDKNLVTEQSGMRVLIVGLVLAFFLGHLIKTLLSPSRVAAQIEKAASHIHKDIKVSFKDAQVSLSDGIIPRFSVVISKVELESGQACWMTPLLEVDELRLPVSLWGMLTGTGIIKNIEAENVVLTLRSGLQNCTEKNHRTSAESSGADTGKAEFAEAQTGENKNTTSLVQNSAETSSQEPTQLVRLTPNEQAEKYKNAIRELSINSLKIFMHDYPQYPSEFLNFSAKVKSFEPKIIEVTAKTNLLRDEQVGDYLSHANLFIQYKESPELRVQSHFFGNWREGHYSMIANYSIADHLLNVETDLKHIPLSQVLSLLQKYNLVSRELNGKQVWVSANARMTADVQKIKSAPLEVSNFQLEGDLGEMQSEQVTFTSLEPLRYKPILIDVKKLQVDHLLKFLNREQAHRILGSLGVFSGRAEIKSENQIHLSGEHTNLEFIFSNKGQRELQVIDKMVGDIDFSGDAWNFQIQRVEPRGGRFQGSVKLKADRDFKDVNINTRIDEIVFSPQVQKLMTNGGHFGAAALNAEARVTQGDLSYLKGLLHIESMNIEGMEFGKTRGAFDYAHNEIILSTKMQNLVMSANSPGGVLLKTVTPVGWWEDGKLLMQDLNGQFAWKDLQHFQWRSFQAKIDKNRFLTADGSWDEQGDLHGALLLRDGKARRKFVLEGDRDNPMFSPEAPAKQPMRK